MGGSIHRLSLMGSDGYHLSLSSYVNHKYKRITLSVEKHGLYARYSVRGVAHNRAITAIYPGVGRVAVHFVPSTVKEMAPHAGCRKPSGAIESGTYVGVIRFRGEKRFTEVNASHAHGIIVKRFRQLCRVLKRGATGSRRFPPRHFEDIQLSAMVGAVRFTAGNTVGESQSHFEVKSNEMRRGMHIARGISEVTGQGDFSYDGPMTEAAVAPPPPFQGRASYSGSGNPKSPMTGFFTQGSLLGSLRVFLPGLGDVNLATDETKASMSRSAGVSN